MWSITCILMLCSVLSLDGANTRFQFIADPTDCTKFSIQLMTFKWDVSCGPGKVFSKKISNCALQNGPYDDCSNRQQNQPSITIRAYEDVFNYCAQCPTCLYPDANNCAGFYNCSKVNVDESGNLGQYQDECMYPGLFDADILGCETDYKKVEGKCNGRPVLLNPCDQRRNQCARAHCRPCNARYPNCAGKSNGFQEWEGRSLTPYYARCQDGRTLEAGTCARSRSGAPRIFSASQKECVDVDAKTFFNN
ncbi:hypothetical protein SNE40_015437 [Patella caerulea]|uniref:Chitin-binding type-2 domain-containing protein n=1 Tax=Patella caerulea TaxID=87958 RepID=A0AAN8PS15_PATCE